MPQKVEFKGKDYIIKDDPFTVGEKGRVLIYTDVLINTIISQVGGISEISSKSVSSATWNYWYNVARALVIVKAGFVFNAEQNLSYLMMRKLESEISEDVIKFINNKYNEICPPPTVSSVEEAKKKDRDESDP